MQCRSAERRHDADGSRHHGQRAFACRIEQSFALQPCLALQELLEERALPGARQAFDDQLQIAARLVHRQASANLDLIALSRNEIQHAGRTPEHGAAQLAATVLQGEVAVTAGSTRKARDFAADGHRIEACVERFGHRVAKRADIPDAHARSRNRRARAHADCASRRLW